MGNFVDADKLKAWITENQVSGRIVSEDPPPPPPTGKVVVFDAPFTDSSQWTVGRTSAFPGAIPQTNPGDSKSDRISPSISAPDGNGTFHAVRNGNFWDADLVTTEYSPGNFQVQVGDTLTATVTLNAQVGAWPAIWTWSTGSLQNLTGHGEVDLFEYHGNNPNLLEFGNHVQPSSLYVGNIVTPGVPFELKVEFLAAGVKYYINNSLKATLRGLPSNWKSNLIVNMSVASVNNPYHPEPPSTVNDLNFRVTDLKVWR